MREWIKCAIEHIRRRFAEICRHPKYEEYLTRTYGHSSLRRRTKGSYRTEIWYLQVELDKQIKANKNLRAINHALIDKLRMAAEANDALLVGDFEGLLVERALVTVMQSERTAHNIETIRDNLAVDIEIAQRIHKAIQIIARYGYVSIYCGHIR